MSDVTHQVKHPAQSIHHSQTTGEDDCLVTVKDRLPARPQCWCERNLEQKRLKLMHTWQLGTMTDKGRLLTDDTVKSRTVVGFTSGKGYA